MCEMKPGKPLFLLPSSKLHIILSFGSTAYYGKAPAFLILGENGDRLLVQMFSSLNLSEPDIGDKIFFFPYLIRSVAESRQPPMLAGYQVQLFLDIWACHNILKREEPLHMGYYVAKINTKLIYSCLM